MEKNELALKALLQKNTPFHLIVEQEVQQTPFGTITFNVMLVNGVAQLETTNIVKNRRRRYKGVDKQAED